MHTDSLGRLVFQPQGAYSSFLWPRFGENTRILERLVDRVGDCGRMAGSPVGWMARREEKVERDDDRVAKAVLYGRQLINCLIWR